MWKSIKAGFWLMLPIILYFAPGLSARLERLWMLRGDVVMAAGFGRRRGWWITGRRASVV